VRFVVVDVGNTSTAVGLWVNGRVSHVSHCDGGFEEARKVVEALLAKKASAVAYVSVVPSVDAAWAAFAAARGVALWQVSSAAVAKESRLITVDYPQPETIGADRLADAAGAVSRYGSPLLVMDFGTALTAAVVTEGGVGRGGVIAPGFPLMRDYLYERTAKLPRMTLGTGRVPKIGRSTEEAMRFGALVGYRGMVREIVAELKKNFKTDFRLVATGGFASWVLKGLDLPFAVDRTLTLFGAGLICREMALAKR
jgi:type III pantothenate kinase